MNTIGRVFLELQTLWVSNLDWACSRSTIWLHLWVTITTNSLIWHPCLCFSFNLLQLFDNHKINLISMYQAKQVSYHYLLSFGCFFNSSIKLFNHSLLHYIRSHIDIELELMGESTRVSFVASLPLWLAIYAVMLPSWNSFDETTVDLTQVSDSVAM